MSINSLGARLGRAPTVSEVVADTGFSISYVYQGRWHLCRTGHLPRHWHFSMSVPLERVSRYGEVRDFVLSETANGGSCPSYAEIAEAVGIGRRAAQEHLATLILEGTIEPQRTLITTTEIGELKRLALEGFLSAFNRRSGYSPSVAECCAALGWDASTVRYYIDMAAIEGRITHEQVAWRQRFLTDG